MKHIFSTTTKPVVDRLELTIRTKLQEGKKVLWLVSGGSGGQVSVDVAKRLQDINTSNLSVTLSDERYGPAGHSDENWQQLLDAGFSLPGANTYRPLQGDDIESTTKSFSGWLARTSDQSDYIIGIFGIGADGHTAGIKAGSSAVSSNQLTASFKGEDYQRITITPKFIESIDEAVIQAMGDEKHQVIRQLLNETITVDEQPAQILKVVPDSTLYSDYKENMK